MSKHTPGPWGFHPCDELEDSFNVLCEKDYYVATTHDGVRGDRNADANARLIAAAPAMYALLAKRAAGGDNECRSLIESIGNE